MLHRLFRHSFDTFFDSGGSGIDGKYTAYFDYWRRRQRDEYGAWRKEAFGACEKEILEVIER
jgi:hypothetical protein